MLWMLVMATALAGKPSLIPSEAPAFAKPGTVMVYNVMGAGQDKQLELTLRQTEGDLVFDWTMSNGMAGSRTISAADRASARAQNNYFQDGETGAHPGSSTVFLSRVQMDEIAQKGKTRASIDGREVKLKFTESTGLVVPVGGSNDTFMVWNLVGPGTQIEVFGNPEFPLILGQDVGFQVAITSITPAPASAPEAAPASAPEAEGAEDGANEPTP